LEKKDVSATIKISKKVIQILNGQLLKKWDFFRICPEKQTVSFIVAPTSRNTNDHVSRFISQKQVKPMNNDKFSVKNNEFEI
jgi:hypothetical protein